MGQNRVTKTEWEKTQVAEDDSWTTGCFPCFKGKLNREKNNQRSLVRELGFDVYVATIPSDRDIYLLDIGAGPRSAFEDFSFMENVRPIATDPLANEYHKFGRYEMDKYRTEYYSYPGENLAMCPRDIPYFDAVFCSNSLDHAQDPQKVCQEIKRVLKTGGLLFIQFCLNNAEHNKHEAHKINLDDIVVQEWLDMELIRCKFGEYSWAFQPSVCMVLKKS